MTRKSHFDIDQEISKATTLPSVFYKDSEVFHKSKETIFAPSWQLIGDVNMLNEEVNQYPINLLPRLLDEPLLLARDEDHKIHCFSNVCTHRANLLVTSKQYKPKILCGYHGRRFNLCGKFEFMPEFEDSEDFPSEKDHLHELNMKQWHQFLFVNLSPEPVYDLDWVLNELDHRTGFLPLEKFYYSKKHGREYEVKAHWALYCDNYLEGFHIPFVHKGLNQSLEYASYDTVLFEYCNLQIGYGKGDTECFDLPEGHPDFGKKVAAYYFWIFPNLMLNFYPWGLSVNIVLPQTPQSSIIKYLTYIYDESKVNTSAGASLDVVEMEDDDIVERAQAGITSRFYDRGRFSPEREKGVHHFHRLISRHFN